MKKYLLMAFALIVTTGLSNAQFFNYGIKGGVNYSKLKFDDIKNIDGTVSQFNLMEDESFRSFHFGLMTRVKIFNLFLQPELYFSTSGGKVLIEEIPDGGGPVIEYAKEVKFAKVDLPVLLGVKVGPLRFNAGPVASVTLSENNEIGEIIPELESLSTTATLGYQAGLGVDILKFLTLDYRYEGSLRKFQESLTVGGNTFDFDSRANMHLISLGIMF